MQDTGPQQGRRNMSGEYKEETTPEQTAMRVEDGRGQGNRSTAGSRLYAGAPAHSVAAFLRFLVGGCRHPFLPFSDGRGRKEWRYYVGTLCAGCSTVYVEASNTFCDLV